MRRSGVLHDEEHLARLDQPELLACEGFDGAGIGPQPAGFVAKTGIDVDIEAISYIDMHSKLVPQLSSPQGSYDAIVVDFYWVGEFVKA